MAGSVIVNGARTPMGRLLGSLKDFSGADLGAVAIKAALERSGVAGDQVQYVIMGQVLQAGAGQIPARQAAVKAGIPMNVPALTINKVCLSGLDAIALADQLIRSGEFDIIVAGGQESMTQAPHLLPKSRSGYKYGAVELLDAMAFDGLTDAFDHIPMGESTEHHNGKLDLTREQQDEFAARSHQRAAVAQKNGVFDEEIATVSIPQRKGDPIEFREDEGIRADTTADSLGKLRPAFTKDGTITAGSASQISDGAAAVVVMSKAKAEELGLSWLAEIGAHGNVAGPDNSLQSQPANAIKHALGKAGKQVGDLDLIEINEAFAAVGVQSMKDLGVSADIVNVNGGAIALGHPIGMSGARLALTLALELKRRGGGLGAAALCGGGGQGDALLLTVARLTRHHDAVVNSRRDVDVPDLVARALDGSARAVARLISLVENDSPALRAVAAALAPHGGHAQIVGLTGSPGVGKSTSTSAYVSALRAAGKRVGVLAVDPSSPFSGGALLGDRVRMQDHATDEGVFIRSMASRGQLGGLSAAVPQALRVLDAAGCDVILVETVGVGQAEVEIASLADTTLLVLAPGFGDGIQAAKAGIIEIADIFVVNKADRDGADQVVRDLRYMQSLGGRHSVAGAWRPMILKTMAVRGPGPDSGVEEVIAAVDRHRAWMAEHGEQDRRRQARAAAEVEAIALGTVRRRLGSVHGSADLDAAAARVVAGETDPYTAAEDLVAAL